ncbi:MAG: GNAT family N-acetyltransferase [Caldisericaceae bacterium]|nr:GNAT family N-acetyltransferase [Caldisericaceae bacterium]
MAIEVFAVRTKKEFKEFLNLEWKINQNTPNWVSPLRMERAKLLDKKKNPFFKHAEMEMFLAKKDGNLVGRIAAIVNENHNKFHGDNWGFWGFFESINDQQVANALFTAAADWLRAKNRDNMVGPMNPSTNDECGLLIEGFDTPPFVMMTHSPDYYPALVEGFGNKKIKDLYAWYLTTETALANITDKLERIANKIKERHSITFRNAELKHIKREVKLIKEIYNDAWSKNWGFVPFTDEEIDYLAGQLKQIVDEDLLILALKNDEPIAFSLTIPNINEILAKIPDGRLFPTGIFKLLFGFKNIKTVRVITLGVKREYQHQGLGSIFYIETIKRAAQKGITAGELSWILEDNHPMNSAIQALGSELYKRYRIYQFPLST